MGESAALIALEWQIGREEQDELTGASHKNAAAAYDEGFFGDLLTPFKGLDRGRHPARRLDGREARHAQAGLRPGRGRHADRRRTARSSPTAPPQCCCAARSTRSPASCDSLAYFTALRDRRGRLRARPEGLLMAPAYAVPRMLDRDGLSCRTSTSTRSTRRSPRRCWPRSGLGRPDLLQGAARPRHAARPDRPDQAQRGGSSLATGHPFAATGGRIVATLAKLLAEKGTGRA